VSIVLVRLTAVTIKRKFTMKKNIVLNLALLTGVLVLGGWREARAQLNLTNFTSADIGSPAVAGSATSLTNGFDLTGAGSDIGSTSDSIPVQLSAVHRRFRR